MQQSFVNHRKGLWMWVALALCAASILGYAMVTFPEPHNGGTWLGYVLGTIGALLIVWLLYLGRRKRNYTSTLGTVRGWTSAHVFLGSSLLIVATLHTGIQFGWNVHTLAYGLMCLVIFSGFFGVWAYLRYPNLSQDNAEGVTLDELFQEVTDVDRKITRAAQPLTPDLQTLVGSAIDRTSVGGGALKQLGRRDTSQVALPDGSVVRNPQQSVVIEKLVERISQSSHAGEGDIIRNIVDLFGVRGQLLRRIRRDIQIQAILRIWLYIHVPLSFGCVAALIVHIVSVFVYW